jgi:exoribonuclease R
MIETFMVAANEAAARFLGDNGVPAVYRIHPLPARLDIERFNDGVEALGLGCPIIIDYERFTDRGGRGGTEGMAGAVQGEAGAKSRRGREAEAQQAGEDAILEMLKSGGKFSLIPGAGEGPGSESRSSREEGKEGDEDDTGPVRERKPSPPQVPLDPEKIEHYSSAYAESLRVLNAGDDRVFRDVMNLLVLRTMPRALYSTVNIGHFGLKSTCYTHFTSPIRRYPDVLVHRAVRALLRGEDPPHDEGELDELVERCNEQSEAAEKFEYAMVDAALAIWLSRDSRERDSLRSGVVFSLAPSAMFVRLEHGVEGRIPLSKLSELRPALNDSETSVVLSTLENPSLAEELGGMDRVTAAEDGHLEKVLYTLGQAIRVTIHRIHAARGRVELSILHAGAGAGGDVPPDDVAGH